jgi:putative nucleotidyltransferase with HDIG domain
VDEVCRAFASIVDAKSEFTGQHSARVMGYSVEIAEALDLGQERIATLRRAALLHDIGKLGISNAILDKPGQLTDDEFAKVKQHPRFSYEILSRIRGFARLADIAGAHHERLDGRGYWRGMTGGQLDREMRILAVADVFDALSADRPYRGAMPMEQVFRILDGQAGTGLDADCVEVLREKYGPRVLVAG